MALRPECRALAAILAAALVRAILAEQAAEEEQLATWTESNKVDNQVDQKDPEA